MKLKYICALLALQALIPQGVSAQLKESVQVSGEYLKEILYPDKLGQLPQRLRLPAPASDIPYSLQGVEAEFVPSAVAIPATASGASRPSLSPRGYLSLEMGSWLNTSLAAGITAIDDDRQSLSFWLRHASTSLWQPYKELYEDASVTPPHRFSYQEALGARWNRSIGSGQLSASLAYRWGHFNYYGLIPNLDPMVTSSTLASTEMKDNISLPSRVTNDFAAEVAYSSAPFMEDNEKGRNHWDISLGLRHYGYNLASKETHLRLSGNYSRMLGDSRDYGISYPSAIGIDVAVDGLFYGMSSTPQEFFFYNRPDDYGNVRISPFYRFNTGNLGLRIGFNADLTFNADGLWKSYSGEVTSLATSTLRGEGHYGLFHVSPDVRFDYSSGGFAAFIHATGGQQLMTLASEADRNMYGLPFLQSTTPVFVPLDAKLGFRLTPLIGLSAEAAVGYRLTRNVPYAGWGMPLMNEAYYPEVAGLPTLTGVPEGNLATYGLGAQRYNLSGIYVDINLGYKISRYAFIHAAMQYVPQNASHGIFNGADRSRWLLSPGFEITPTDALSFGMDYEYHGVRNIWSGIVAVATPPADEGKLQLSPSNGGGTSVGPVNPSNPADGVTSTSGHASLRLPDITRLNAHASYNFGDVGPLRNLSIGIEARNLLNQSYILLPGLPSEALTVMGIIRMQF